MSRRLDIDETEFHAFVDGQLEPERRRAVMAHLAGHPDDVERLGQYRRVNEELHLLYDDVLHEPLPERLRTERYRKGVPWLERCRSWLGFPVPALVPRLAGAALLVLMSGSGGWWLHAHTYRADVETPAMAFARSAASAHQLYAPDLRHPVEFGADQQDRLQLWFSERLAQPVRAPNLQEIGFELVGGRLLPSAGQAAAQLMYENPEAKRVTLYIRGRWAAAPALSAAQEGTVSYSLQGDLSMVYWIDGALAYALLGPMDREQLFTAAKTIQQQLQGQPLAPLAPLPSPTADQTADKDAT